MEKLSLVALKLVHKCQAAFIKKRSIHDQINLVTWMTDLCEITGQNGAIITLDQEKAYDKIRHDYLWRVLKEMNIPNSMINTIQSLYTNVEMMVILNGKISKKFLVTREVSQEHPLFSQLFNFTIEHMCHLLRSTEQLS